MRGGNTRSYPSFPDIEDQLGYNPARFLDVSADAQDSIGETSELVMAESVIQGIEDVETIQAWFTVEAQLDRGPRRKVIDWLDQRKSALQGPETQADGTEQEHESSSDDTTQVIPEETPSDEDATVGEEENTTGGTATAATNAPASVATDGGTASLSDPTCSECGDDLTPEEIAGKLGYWCPRCSDFREPEAKT